MLSTILRSSTSNLNSLGSSAPVELPLRRVVKSMRPVGAQSRFTTPWYAVCFSSLHLLNVSTLGKYVSTLAIFFSFFQKCRQKGVRPLMRLREEYTYSRCHPHGGSAPANLKKHLTFKVTRLGLRRHHSADTLLCRLLLAVVRSKISAPPSADSAGPARVIFRKELRKRVQPKHASKGGSKEHFDCRRDLSGTEVRKPTGANVTQFAWMRNLRPGQLLLATSARAD